MNRRSISKHISLSILACIAGAAAGVAACGPDIPTDTADATHEHAAPVLDVMISEESRPDVRRQLVELRRMTARFHNIDQAVRAGYDFNVGCIDETIAGLDPSEARGMGYHVTKSGTDLVGDPAVDLLEPEFLVYEPSRRDASLPEDQRLSNAKLIGVEYVVPGDPVLGPNDPNPPTLFGDPFDWSAPFQSWVRHIFIWDRNPDGLYANYNAAVPLCTQLLGGEPIQ